MSSTWIWYTARAAGMVAWVLLAIAVILGLVRSTNVGRARRSSRPAGSARGDGSAAGPQGPVASLTRPAWVVEPFSAHWHPVPSPGAPSPSTSWLRWR